MWVHYHLKMSIAHYQALILLLTPIFSCGERPWTLEWIDCLVNFHYLANDKNKVLVQDKKSFRSEGRPPIKKNVYFRELLHTETPLPAASFGPGNKEPTRTAT